MKKLVLLVFGLAAIGFCGFVGFVVWFNAASAPTTLAPLSDSRSDLVILLRHGTLGLRVTNDTDVTWRNCEAQIAGGFTARQPLLPPHETVNFPYAGFSSASTRLEEDQGYARALRGTLISCTGPDSRVHHARVE